MFKSLRYVLFAFLVFCGALRAPAQTAPCTAGSLANVLGTSCSVGPLTLNLQNNFSSLFTVAEIIRF